MPATETVSGMAEVKVKGLGLQVLACCVVPCCKAGEAAACQGSWQTEDRL